MPSEKINNTKIIHCTQIVPLGWIPYSNGDPIEDARQRAKKNVAEALYTYLENAGGGFVIPSHDETQYGQLLHVRYQAIVFPTPPAHAG